MSKNSLINPKELMGDIAVDLAACFMFAVSTQVFNAPGNIAPGGVTGISILLNYLFGWPISMLSLLINIPLLVLAYLFVGKRFTFKTLTTVIILTAMLSLVALYLPQYKGETILAALAGGVLSGAALAMCFMRSTTTGGTDIIARLIQKRFPDMASGRLLLMVDAVILLCATLVYRNMESALFALVSIFTRSQVLDSIMCGRDLGKVLLVVSNNHEEMADGINSHMHRGCTVLDGKGSYTKQDRPVLLCVVRKPQYYELKKLVNSIDPEAFIIAMEASEIIGEGFKNFSSHA